MLQGELSISKWCSGPRHSISDGFEVAQIWVIIRPAAAGTCRGDGVPSIQRINEKAPDTGPGLLHVV